VQIINLIYNDDWSGIPDANYVAQWANKYGFTNVAALAPLEPNPMNILQESKSSQWVWDLDGGASSYYHLDRNMRVISADEYRPTPPKLAPLTYCKACPF